MICRSALNPSNLWIKLLFSPTIGANTIIGGLASSEITIALLAIEGRSMSNFMM
jgi:hypothetical protein